MLDRVVLLIVGCICAGLAWASWRFGGEPMTGVVMAVVVVAYAVDNFQLRRQVRELLADRDKREKREKEAGLKRLMHGLLAVREKRRES